MECVLVQVILTDGARRLQRQPVPKAQRVHAYQPHDLVQRGLILQYAHGLLSQAVPFRADVGVIPTLDPVGIQRVALQPVDSREVALIRQAGASG